MRARSGTRRIRTRRVVAATFAILAIWTHALLPPGFMLAPSGGTVAFCGADLLAYAPAHGSAFKTPNRADFGPPVPMETDERLADVCPFNVLADGFAPPQATAAGARPMDRAPALIAGTRQTAGARGGPPLGARAPPFSSLT